MLRAILLGLVLFATWLLLSGHYTVLITGLGVVSCAVSVWIAHRMELVDRESHPLHIGSDFLLYLPWLLWEILKANIDVARRIVDPRLPVSPLVFAVRASQQSELGRVIYANSITLTPGTVTLRLDDDVIEVHALHPEAADGLAAGDMDRRVTRVENHHVRERPS